MLVVHAKRGRMSEEQGSLILELEDGVSYEEHRESVTKTSERVHPHIQSSFARQRFQIPLHSLDFSMANEDLFRRSFEQMDLRDLAYHSDSLKQTIEVEREALVQYGLRQVERIADTTGWYGSPQAVALQGAGSPWHTTLAPVTLRKVLSKAKEATRNEIRSLDNAVTNMEGKQKRQFRHDIEWHRKCILAIGCMVLFAVGSSLGALVGRGGLGVPTILALCVFLLYYTMSMLGEQLVKTGSLTPATGMWLSTLVLIPLAMLLLWSTNRERRWLPRWGTS